MLRDRTIDELARDAVAIVVVPPYLAGAWLLEKLGVIRGRGWMPDCTWKWARRAAPRAPEEVAS